MKQSTGASVEFARGVEITDQHGLVDWNAAAASGLTFAYLAATRGPAEQGKHSAANWGEMGRVRILRGACHYFQPLKDPEAQAQHFGSVAAVHTDLPPALRLKAVPTQTGLNEWDGVRKDQRPDTILRCLTAIQKAFGRKPILFTNAWFLRELRDLSALQNYDLWLADYHYLDAPLTPAPWTEWKFWRYAEVGEVAGIRGPVCLDRFNGSASALRQFAGGAVEGRPQVADELAEEAKPDEEDMGERVLGATAQTGSRTVKSKSRSLKREETPRSSTDDTAEMKRIRDSGGDPEDSS